LAHPRLRRDPDLAVVWRGTELLIRNVRTGRSLQASVGAIALLSEFDRPCRAAAVTARAPAAERRTLSRAIGAMCRIGLLARADGAEVGGRLAAWDGNVASALYHAATRDLEYIESPARRLADLRKRHADVGPPRGFKRYGGAPMIPLDCPDPRPVVADLGGALDLRRTTRDFARRVVPLPTAAAVIRGTWGQTGWLDGRDLGRAPTRTSPSGGALHPIECYVLALGVGGLEAGLYHYDVPGNELRRLKAGTFRLEAVRLASGQRWVGRAAFLCIMTAVFERTMWKYRRENAYRTVWIEAGHFAQTFSLLATSYGLGPFTTAAMQDSRIERFIGLDGVREFPVYLCGAGVPGSRRINPRWTPIVVGSNVPSSVSEP
jgi:SagB-type dehydrogenase family enzyme